MLGGRNMALGSARRHLQALFELVKSGEITHARRSLPPRLRPAVRWRNAPKSWAWGESTNGHAGAALGKPAVFGDDRSDWQLIAGDEVLEPAGQPAIRYPRDLVGDDEQRVVSRLFDQPFEPVEFAGGEHRGGDYHRGSVQGPEGCWATARVSVDHDEGSSPLGCPLLKHFGDHVGLGLVGLEVTVSGH